MPTRTSCEIQLQRGLVLLLAMKEGHNYRIHVHSMAYNWAEYTEEVHCFIKHTLHRIEA